MIRTFNDAVKFLDSYIPDPTKKFPGELGLRRMKRLCELLGNPQLLYKTIHVGGTSGKGSTATIIATILAQKYKVGLHTSPHLEKINERLKIYSKLKNQNSKIKTTDKNSKINDIPDDDFMGMLNEVIPIINKLEKSSLGKPSFFEIVTAMAFLYFAKQKVDYAVIEVGMGGRFDATNVIVPEVAVLTNVGLDHTEILGSTVEKIAQDKVGIIKKGIQVVSGVTQPSVIRILKSKIKNQKSMLSLLGKQFSYEVKKIDQNGCLFNYNGMNRFNRLHLSLLGQHQVENASIALSAIEITNNKLQITDAQLRNGLKNIRIPGRLEIIQRHPFLVLDGAHNPDKIRALVSAVRTLFPTKKVIAVVAIKRDKNAREMISLLSTITRKFIFTQYRLKTDVGNTVSYSAKELVEINSRDSVIQNNPLQAMKAAKKEARIDDLILVTGSLYLIGEMKRNLK